MKPLSNMLKIENSYLFKQVSLMRDVLLDRLLQTAIERLQIKIAEILNQKFNNKIRLLLFNTHE